MDSFDGGPPVDVPPAYTSSPPGPMFARVLREGAHPDPPTAPRSPTDGLVAVRRHRPPLALADVRADPPRRAHHRHHLHPELHRRTPTTRSDLATLQELADHCGGAIERLRIEHELRESQAQLARTEAFALVMTAHLSLDGRWLKVPPTLCRLLGVDDSRLLGTADRARCCTPTTSPPSGPSGDRLVRGRDPERATWRPAGRGPTAACSGCISTSRSVPDADGRAALPAGVPAGRHRAEEPRGAAPPGAEDGGGRPARRRHRARLQQPAHGHPGLRRAAAGEHPASRTRGGEDAAGDQPRGRTAPPGLTRQLLAFSRKQVLQPRLVEPQRDRARAWAACCGA